jgi:hypothetical protein
MTLAIGCVYSVMQVVVASVGSRWNYVPYAGAIRIKYK